MVETEFDFKLEGERPSQDAFLDEYELELLFEHTREQIRRTIEQKLGSTQCKEHGKLPYVKITGTYSLDNEQFDIHYHIDTCCKRFLMESIRRLNN